MNFIPCISWVKQGVSKAIPDKVKLNQEELESIIKKTQQDIEDADDSGTENVTPSAGGTNNADDEYDFEHYDDDPDPADDPHHPLALGTVAVSLTDSGAQDGSDDDDSEKSDFEIHPGDNLILAGHVDDDCGILDVYIYNEDEGYLYVHHDLFLPSLPLCFTWLNHEPGEATPGNLVAVGSMSSVIDVWDIDIVDCLEPAFQLGRKASKKKKIKAKGHKKAVLDLAWNHNLTHILASGSADETVLLWDLDNGEPSNKLENFGAPVQALAWHPTTSYGLLTGCCDKIVRAYDCRTDNTFLEFPVPGEVERVAWNHFNSFYFLTSTDAGNIHCFDTRNQKQLWQINQAHSKEVTGLSLSCSCPGLLVTGSMDGRLLIWDILDASQDAPPTLVDEKALSVGAIYTIQTSPDAPFVVSVGGDNKENLFTVWHMEESEAGLL
ncbi:hypothetical protein B566_EDAN008985 [Ephemera danica]|nr:hypothetical protein B566_EDAN008985 [Ephemera danica]